MNIRYPKITGRTPEERLAQMESWLRQLVDQLNYLIQAGENNQNSQRG